MELSSSVGFFLAVTIALSMILQMQTPAEAISCDPVETRVMTNSSFNNFRRSLQNECVKQGREASKSEFNIYPINQEKIMGEGCCQVRLPTSPPPPPAPVDWKKCRAGDTSRPFKLIGAPKDCTLCFNKCETKCRGLGIGFRAADQVCLYLHVVKTKAYVGLTCTCCCRKRIVLPSSPPLPLPAPPLPLPSPPPSPLTPFLPTCSVIRDFDGCLACAIQCETKCSAMGTTVAEELCLRRRSSTRVCQCCCEPPRPAPAPAPLALPPSSTPPPPPPPNANCPAGEKYFSIAFSNEMSCTTCATDCLRRCSDSLLPRLVSQRCKIDDSTSSEFCECCCTA